jgi:hypothetical protein
MKTNITHRDMIHKIKESMNKFQEYLITCESEYDETISVDDETISVNEETVDEETVDEETVDEETVDEETVNEETVDEETVDEETVDEETVDEETVDEETVFINKEISHKLSEDIMIFTHNYIQKALITTAKTFSGKKKCYFPTVDILNENGYTKDCINHFGKMKGLKIKYKTWLHLKSICNP